MTPRYRILPAGDTALVVEFGDRIDRRLSALVLALARRIEDARIDGVIETVPTFRSLMIHYEPLTLPPAALMARIADLARGLRMKEGAGRLWRLPVCYDESLAPDLAFVAEQSGLSAEDVVAQHAATRYHVYMLGFLPGQAYMGDLPAPLCLPRRQTPRTKIPAGSLAIAMAMTCIFPRETPCGWHLIGRSPVRLFDETHGALILPGDKVGFAPVSLREYEDLDAMAKAGALTIEPVADNFEAAA